jgi:hypothetical protein
MTPFRCGALSTVALHIVVARENFGNVTELLFATQTAAFPQQIGDFGGYSQPVDNLLGNKEKAPG